MVGQAYWLLDNRRGWILNELIWFLFASSSFIEISLMYNISAFIYSHCKDHIEVKAVGSSFTERRTQGFRLAAPAQTRHFISRRADAHNRHRFHVPKALQFLLL